MASVSLHGPYHLSQDIIDAVVPHHSAGSFVLGTLSQDGSFTPRYVGRSDHDVCAELQFQLRLVHQGDAFTFRSASAPWQAFEQQCEDYHACGEGAALENSGHPSRPSHADWTCPICGDRYLKTL